MTNTVRAIDIMVLSNNKTSISWDTVVVEDE